MLTTPRRITLYWLLLLVPALAVGGGTILLLRREHARLQERTAEAELARRAAVSARARLIAENVELLVGDVQTGLLDTLAAEPAEGLDAFLEQWQTENPLVRVAFRASVDGRILWPDTKSSSDEARGFRRRFSRQFGGRLPWNQSAAAEVAKKSAPPQPEPDTRQGVEANVAQAASARRDVQELVKTPAYSKTNSFPADARPQYATADADRETAGRRETFARSQVARDRDVSTRADSRAASAPTKSAVAAPKLRAKDMPADRRGWMPWTLEGHSHVLGWVQPAGFDEVRGLELELAALVSRLGGALPAETGFGEGYVLRDGTGQIMHQAGSAPSNGVPSVRVPLATVLLPGWEVVGYITLAPTAGRTDRGWFWASALLVGLFITAIVAGGSLLLWQARRSEIEAAQKTSFVANVSHEFKTPLTTIRLYSELLEQGRVRDEAKAAEYLQTIGRETQRLARLVNNVLDFSRLEQGRKKYAREKIDLVAELDRLLEAQTVRLSEGGLRLERAWPATPVVAVTDRDAVEQIVLNLLDNACKYAASGGEVLVTVAPVNGGVAVRVADRGPGVPPAHRDRIFEKFHRVDETLTAAKTGAGLGLSIARQLARGLGGDLRYEARADGGAEFILELPNSDS